MLDDENYLDGWAEAAAETGQEGTLSTNATEPDVKLGGRPFSSSMAPLVESLAVRRVDTGLVCGSLVVRVLVIGVRCKIVAYGTKKGRPERMGRNRCWELPDTTLGVKNRSER